MCASIKGMKSGEKYVLAISFGKSEYPEIYLYLHVTHCGKSDTFHFLQARWQHGGLSLIPDLSKPHDLLSITTQDSS